MNFLDYILVAGLALWMLFSALYIHKQKKKGNSCCGCSGCCKNCNSCGSKPAKK